MELDKGVVHGTTWHGLDQYITQDMPVTVLQAREVLNFPLEKRRLFVQNSDGYTEVEAWCIVRSDKDVVLVPHVGSKYVALNNNFLLSFVEEHLLAQHAELKIESVGTLFNGATSFVNLKLDEFQVKGDKSPTLSRLMYANPLGRGSYTVCAHDIRIVCNNTLQAASAQGAANNTLRKVRHTQGAAQQINDSLVDLAEVKMGLKQHVEKLEVLSDSQMDTSDVDAFLSTLFPMKEDAEGRTRTIANGKREKVLRQFESNQGLTLEASTSRYGMLQAVTNYFDHQTTARGGDKAFARWDGIVGERAKTKNAAFNTLLAGVE
jgi:phage/plasmid-like protein (TIGR03299 family)